MTAVMLYQQKVPVLSLTPGRDSSLHHHFSFQSGHAPGTQGPLPKCRPGLRYADLPSSSPPAGTPEAMALPSLSLARVATQGGFQVGSARKKTSKVPHFWPLLGAPPKAGYFLKSRSHRGSSRAGAEQEEPRLKGTGLGMKCQLATSRSCGHKKLWLPSLCFRFFVFKQEFECHPWYEVDDGC